MNPKTMTNAEELWKEYQKDFRKLVLMDKSGRPFVNISPLLENTIEYSFDKARQGMLSADEVEKLKMNNCPKCLQRIFITSSGLAECSKRCPNWLRPLGYIPKELGLK